MPECFYRASSVFCDTGYNRKTLDSRLKVAGMTACDVFDLCQYNFETLNNYAQIITPIYLFFPLPCSFCYLCFSFLCPLPCFAALCALPIMLKRSSVRMPYAFAILPHPWPFL